MPQNASHWYTNSHGPDIAALRSAFEWLVREMQTSTSRSGLLAIPGKGNVEGAIETVLGSAAVKQLTKNNSVRSKVGTLELMTEKVRRSAWAGPVLAVYPTPKLLEVVDNLHGATAVLVVPWLRDEINPWIRIWAARQLGSADAQTEQVFSNPTVRAALESLTNHINMGTGLAHPSDRTAAVEMFRLLQRAGEHFNPEEVRGWLISQLKWQPRHASDVAEVAEKILAGHQFRLTTSGGWATDAVDRWRAKAAEGPGERK